MNWEEFRREDKSIDLVKAWLATLSISESISVETYERRLRVKIWLSDIETYQPIKSRQVAALVLSMINHVIK